MSFDLLKALVVSAALAIHVSVLTDTQMKLRYSHLKKSLFLKLCVSGPFSKGELHWPWINPFCFGGLAIGLDLDDMFQTTILIISSKFVSPPSVWFALSTFTTPFFAFWFWCTPSQMQLWVTCSHIFSHYRAHSSTLFLKRGKA